MFFVENNVAIYSNLYVLQSFVGSLFDNSPVERSHSTTVIIKYDWKQSWYHSMVVWIKYCIRKRIECIERYNTLQTVPETQNIFKGGYRTSQNTILPRFTFESFWIY